MSYEISILMSAAASIAFIHTLIGPDHYIPFIAMSKSGEWSFRKTAWVTVLCGVGHVLSSVLLGFLGVALGIAVTSLELFESFRGNIAAWALIAFGLIYFIWGVRKAIRNKPHIHIHKHFGSSKHTHTHTHNNEHMHVHSDKKVKTSVTPWALFVIFVLGPCEPLIPLLMYPAAKSNIWGLFMVTAIFSIITIVTMLVIVLVASFGINFIHMKKVERYTHALAGLTIFLSGMSIQCLGL